MRIALGLDRFPWKIVAMGFVLVCGLTAGAYAEDRNRIGSSRPMDGAEDKWGVSLSIDFEEIRMLSLDIQRYGDAQEDGWISEQKVRAANYEMLKLALDEFEFLGGLRKLVYETERKVDGYARRLRLKGSLRLTGDQKKGLVIDEQIRVNGGFSLMARSLESRNIFQKMLPDEIRWHLGTDLHAKYLMGEIHFGDYVLLEGNIGKDNGIKLLLEFPF